MKYRLTEKIGSGGMAEVFRAVGEGPAAFGRPVRRQAHPPAPVRAGRVRAHVRRRGEHLGAPHPPEHRPGVRVRVPGRRLLPGDGAGRGHRHGLAAPAAHGAAERAAVAVVRRRGGPAGLPRARLRAHADGHRRQAAGHRPPRRHAAQHHGVVERRGEDPRLRAGARGRGAAPSSERRRDGAREDVVPGARAAGRRAGGRALRPVLAGRRAARAAVGAAAVRR